MILSVLHYSKAPIIEALIDIQIDQLPSDRLESLASLGLATGYSNSGRLGVFQLEGNFQTESGPSASATRTHTGEEFRSVDQKQSFQARLDGLTFSRLTPYTTWEQFRSEAKRIWKIFRNIVGPVQVNQYSVRYINKLMIPAGEEISHYLRTFAQVSQDLPQVLKSQFMRLELIIDNPPGLLIVQQFFSDSDDPESVAMILDNELRYSALSISSDEELWNRVEEVRAVKNKYFKGCLTKEMEERIK